eukprot:762818-Hanusia_phi.AAC.2
MRCIGPEPLQWYQGLRGVGGRGTEVRTSDRKVLRRILVRRRARAAEDRSGGRGIMADYTLTLDVCYSNFVPSSSTPYYLLPSPLPSPPSPRSSCFFVNPKPDSLSSPLLKLSPSYPVEAHPVISSDSTQSDKAYLQSDHGQQGPEDSLSCSLQPRYSLVQDELCWNLPSASNTEADTTRPKLEPSAQKQVNEVTTGSKRDPVRELAHYGLQIMNEMLEQTRRTSESTGLSEGVGQEPLIRSQTEGTELSDSKRFVHKGSIRMHKSIEELGEDRLAANGTLFLDGMEDLSYMSESMEKTMHVCNLHRVIECTPLGQLDAGAAFPFCITHRRSRPQELEGKARTNLFVAIEQEEDAAAEVVETILVAPSRAEREAWLQLISPSNLSPKRLKGEILGSFLNSCRKIVSGNRRRYKDGVYDLDLTYITSSSCLTLEPDPHHVLPPGQFSSMVRNDLKVVRQFFDEKHPGRLAAQQDSSSTLEDVLDNISSTYKVYNLCIEKTYSPKKFDGRMEWFPCNDHQPPSLRQIMRFCYRCCGVRRKLARGGKGRTGLMISCYLIFSGMFSSPAEALSYFEERRTLNSNGPPQAGNEDVECEG